VKDPKASFRREIGLKLKVLREGRRLSQAELAKQLGLSQAGLSLIERGQASLNTEDFLTVLRIFNVPASHFFADQDKGAPGDQLQNALARLGAAHLLENASLPSETLEHASQVIREVLVEGRNPRHITALAPVVVAQIGTLHLPKLWVEFCGLGFEGRLGWLLENTLEALALAPKPRSLAAARNYRQAETVLRQFLGTQRGRVASSAEVLLGDVLGTVAPSPKTLTSLEKQSSPISGKWRILSPIQVQDFVDALKASHDAA